jgi:hypothetical protein
VQNGSCSAAGHHPLIIIIIIIIIVAPSIIHIAPVARSIRHLIVLGARRLTLACMTEPSGFCPQGTVAQKRRPFFSF